MRCGARGESETEQNDPLSSFSVICCGSGTYIAWFPNRSGAIRARKISPILFPSERVLIDKEDSTGVLVGLPWFRMPRGCPGFVQTLWKENIVRKYLAGSLAALLVCVAAGWLYAGAYDQTMGQIKLIDVAGGKLTVSVTQGRNAEAKEVTYLIDKDTTVRVNREKKALTDLAEGNRVMIFFQETDKAGDLPKALMISVMQQRNAGGAGGAGGGGGGGGRRGNGGGGGN